MEFVVQNSVSCLVPSAENNTEILTSTCDVFDFGKRLKHWCFSWPTEADSIVSAATDPGITDFRVSTMRNFGNASGFRMGLLLSAVFPNHSRGNVFHHERFRLIGGISCREWTGNRMTFLTLTSSLRF